MKVLIAEDDRTSRLMLMAMVAKWGYDPVGAADGGVAMDLLGQPDPPRLVLLDWNMPVLSGPDICRRLKDNGSSDPPYLILLTGRRERGDIVLGLDAGANDYVAKPYDPEELQARLQAGRRVLDLQARLLAAQAELALLARRDALTGLDNRRATLERLREEISRTRRIHRRLTVGMCDVDHFKAINDAYGHQTGDDVLKALGSFMQAELRDYDCVGRYGGEEFLIIAPGSVADDDSNLFERLCGTVARLAVPTRSGPLSVSVSIGVARLIAESTMETLIADADAALYRAKAAGRNRVAFAEPTPDAAPALHAAH